ncbi:MAG TPA: hypothetical protein VKE24_15080 [Candidatus Acidoferrales bacterium]|nr:hypothetical protein [Candidatus Acidoferrales bacterium]
MTRKQAGGGKDSRPGTTEVVVRHCQTLDEFEACARLQKGVWGGADIEVVPLPLYVVAAETGGQVLGAFAGETMAGFTLALAGLREGKPLLHSHLTAVLEEYRNLGIGRRLKLFQRQDALGRGIELVEWTFDPLEIKNAYFNLVRLGAIARRFLPNCYGITTSPLHGGLPTDRLMAEWWVGSERVKRALGVSDSVGSGKDMPMERVHVPGEINDLKRTDRARAARMQREIRERFEDCFARGYAAMALERTRDGGDYLLGPWSPS